MPGFTETLVIVAIILAIIVLPKRLSKRSEAVRKPQKPGAKLTGRWSMAILASFLWLAFVALYLEPWHNEWYIFFYAGPGPIILCWGIFWIFYLLKKRGR